MSSAAGSAMDAPERSLDVDVAIVGGGMVGASLAVALAQAPLRLALIEGVAANAQQQPSFDDRTTALGNGSRAIFESLGLWAQIAPQAAPIRSIHVSDAGRFGFARLQAEEQGVDAFGYVVTNRVIGAALRAALQRQRNLELLMPATASEVAPAADDVQLRYAMRDAPGVLRSLRARLVIAADGAASGLRSQLGLAATVEDYEQVALIANVAADVPAAAAAYERFTDTGPIALLPLYDGSFGLIWTFSPAAAAVALEWPDTKFLTELQSRFGWRAGRFTRVGKRTSYPLALTRAERTIAHRAVLIGNAAQSLHPVAGQGFNLGLRDAAVLAETLAAPGTQDVGASEVLERFARNRATDRAGVTRFTDGLVRLFGDSRPGIPALRNIGLVLFDLLPPAKSALAQVSWGFAGRSSRLARGLGLHE